MSIQNSSNSVFSSNYLVWSLYIVFVLFWKYFSRLSSTIFDFSVTLKFVLCTLYDYQSDILISS